MKQNKKSNIPLSTSLLPLKCISAIQFSNGTRYDYKTRGAIGVNIGLVITTALMIVLLYHIASKAIDQSIDNQSIMLCQSAKRSGNVKYTKLCGEYYSTGNISYMRGAR